MSNIQIIRILDEQNRENGRGKNIFEPIQEKFPELKDKGSKAPIPK